MTTTTVRRGDREIGAYVTGRRGPGSFRSWISPPVVLAGLATAAVATASVSAGLALRRRPAIGSVTMGPGGWISLKRTAHRPLRGTGPGRPWWAHLLRARRLVEKR